MLYDKIVKISRPHKTIIQNYIYMDISKNCMKTNNNTHTNKLGVVIITGITNKYEHIVYNGYTKIL
jgi:hypothetical protein